MFVLRCVALRYGAGRVGIPRNQWKAVTLTLRSRRSLMTCLNRIRSSQDVLEIDSEVRSRFRRPRCVEPNRGGRGGFNWVWLTGAKLRDGGVKMRRAYC